MSITPTKYFVVSLPRTGTKSLCKMAEGVGLKFVHTPSVAINKLLMDDGIRFFADTPIFAPSYIRQLVENPSHKFIYIQRRINDWIKSFESVGLNINYTRLINVTFKTNPYTIMDRECLSEVFNGREYTSLNASLAHVLHRQAVYDIIPKDRLLIYKFGMGWKPFCEFLEEPVPDIPLPHINKGTMFEKL